MTREAFAPFGVLLDRRGSIDVDRVVAFKVEGRLPYAYFRGTWHTPPFALGEWYSYLVVDRKGTLEDDWELVDLKTTRGCTFEIDV